jgi:asparagine synthetase B (glutamine-hydrolysing)
LSSAPWFNDTGILPVNTHVVDLANRRFVIMALIKNRHQLLASPDGRSIFSFNRRIFNYGEMMQELDKVSTEGAGRWNSGSDTGALLKSFSTWAVFSTLINDSKRAEWMGIMTAASKHSLGDRNLEKTSEQE